VTSTIKSFTSEEIEGTVDFALITIREDEFAAVLQHFPPTGEFKGKQRTYEISDFKTSNQLVCRTALFRATRPGHAAAQAAASDAITDLNPSWLILVGIAGAVPEYEFSLGDVVVATQIIDFSISAALQDGHRQFALASVPAHKLVQNLALRLPALKDRLGNWNTPEVLQAVCPEVSIDENSNIHEAISPDWKKKLLDTLKSRFQSADRRLPIVTAAPIASGNVLMKDTNLVSRWLESQRDLKAVEMELPGVYEAAHRAEGDKPILAIRGISDIIGLKRDDAWTGFACKTAASLARALLNTGTILLKNKTQERLSSSVNAAQETSFETPQVPRVELNHWPPDKTEDFVGRINDLRALDRAWYKHEINTVVLVGGGGCGKTSLVTMWLNALARNNFGGAQKIFGWSFNGQGHDNYVTPAEDFIEHALKFFEHTKTDKASDEEVSKLERLVACICRQPSILILDGLETIQGIGSDGAARIQHPLVRELVFRLTIANKHGLCLITTHRPVEEIKNFDRSLSRTKDIGRLKMDDALTLLEKFGVRGTKTELKKACREYNYDALALKLLSIYLTKFHCGVVTARGEITNAILPEGSTCHLHAQRVLDAYLKLCKDKRTIEVIYLVSFFDRPIEYSVLNMLRQAPAIPRLTDNIAELSESNWQSLLLQVGQQTRMIEIDRAVIYAHPIIRQHFRSQITSREPKAWREGHKRLYEYFENLGEPLPSTLNDMEPLYQAVSHGCNAGLHIIAFNDVYWPRISRKQEDFSVRQLAAFSAELHALSGFFKSRWKQVVEGLPKDLEGLVMARTGSALRGLSLLQRAIIPLERAITVSVEIKDWEHAAKAAGDLCGLLQILDKLDEANEYGESSVRYGSLVPEQAKKLYYQINGLSRVGEILHRRGQLERAREKFKAAESLEPQRSGCQILLSLAGVRYCDLLVDLDETDEVRARWQILKEPQLAESPLDQPLLQLVLARAELKAGEYEKAKLWLDMSESVIREFDIPEFVARLVLLKAQLMQRQEKIKEATAMLREAEWLIESGELWSFCADIMLLKAALEMRRGPRGKTGVHTICAEQFDSGDVTAFHGRKKEYERLAGEP
jgi:nucleoside phosphorylase/tetratricopeptide (TPR) repeat protein